MENFDQIDLKLLKLLQQNSRLTTKELAMEVGLSISPVYERVKRLENEGYIDKYVALLSPEKLNIGLIAYIGVKLVRQSRKMCEDFVAVIQNIPEVTECYRVAGRYDFLLRVCAPDMKYYRSFLLELLDKIPDVSNVNSTFVMADVKHTTALPLNQL